MRRLASTAGRPTASSTPMPTPLPATLAQALAQAAASGLPRPEAHMLLLHALGRPAHERAWLLAHDSDALPAEQARRFASLCQRRAAGEPVAYLTGRKAFYGLELQVDERVLDPRDDTETLVDWALSLLPAQAPSRPLRALDLGTGSGAIALALASQRPQADIWANDASADALAVAAANAQRLALRLNLRQGDWLRAVADAPAFDLIVSNPPYIAEGDAHLPALAHEPRLALTSGADGLDAIRAIIHAIARAAPARAHLRPGGWLLLEHGHNQAPAVRALLAAAGFARVQSRCDLAGIERCSGGQWPGNKPP